MIRAWFVLFVLGCQQGHKPPPPVARIADAARPDALVPVPVPQDAEQPRDVMSGFPGSICFATSANHRRVACVEEVHDSETSPGTSRVVILGDVGDALSEWNLYSTREIRTALVERKYVAFESHGAPLPLDDVVTVGSHAVRRNRKITNPAAPQNPNAQPGDPDFSEGSWNTYDDQLELACGSRWVEVPLDPTLNLRYGDDVSMQVSAFDDHRILLEVSGSWAIEGEHGSTSGAQLIDAASLCR